jgi:Co/Zn/Cd efflux system component
VSRVGAVFGSIGIILGLWLCWLARWEFDSSLLSIGIACIIPVSALGLVLSLRKKPIQQPQQQRP